jgi:hypothetical protein
LINGRFNDKLRDDLTNGNDRFVWLSPNASLELWTPVLENNLLFLIELNWSCFFCNSSNCALRKMKIHFQ